jgi:dCMP deaminase
VSNRPGWDSYFFGIADAVARRADCTRRRVGAVLVHDNRVVSTGYNGSPAGRPGCLDGACPRGRHYRATHQGGPPADGRIALPGEVCGGCGESWPCPESVPPGSSYDTGKGACSSLHAEENCIIYSSYANCRNSTMYVTDQPCDGCMRMIRGAGISIVLWPGGMEFLG